MASWIPVREDSDFSLLNLPYGVFSSEGLGPRIGTAIGDFVLDLKVLAQDQVFADLKFDTTTLEASTLNPYASLGKYVHLNVRTKLQQLLEEDTQLGQVLRDNQDRRNRSLVPLSSIQMHLPMTCSDYTDFFVGLHHALNSAELVKPGAAIESVCPAFYHLPVAYHGRSSSVVISRTDFCRPKGEFKVDGTITACPTQKLDFEVEFAAFIGRGNDMGSSIDVDNAEDHIFGVVLMNDWSARDVQFWESTPIGPFNGKNFCTTISPWVVPLEALEPFRTAPKEPRQLVPYLTEKRKDSAYNIPIRATLETGSEKYHVTMCNTDNVIFSFSQMLAHHTIGGCPMRTGDLIGTGTLSGPTREELGCFFESTRHGADPYEMKAATSSRTLSRRYLEDGDTVEFTAHVGGKDGLGRVGFGACSGKVLPAI